MTTPPRTDHLTPDPKMWTLSMAERAARRRRDRQELQRLRARGLRYPVQDERPDDATRGKVQDAAGRAR